MTRLTLTSRPVALANNGSNSCECSGPKVRATWTGVSIKSHYNHTSDAAHSSSARRLPKIIWASVSQQSVHASHVLLDFPAHSSPSQRLLRAASASALSISDYKTTHSAQIAAVACRWLLQQRQQQHGQHSHVSAAQDGPAPNAERSTRTGNQPEP